jgi:hypothetical protein
MSEENVCDLFEVCISLESTQARISKRCEAICGVSFRTRIDRWLTNDGEDVAEREHKGSGADPHEQSRHDGQVRTRSLMAISGWQFQERFVAIRCEIASLTIFAFSRYMIVWKQKGKAGNLKNVPFETGCFIKP